MAVSTDCNPGSSACTSMLLMLNMACTLMRLTPQEALLGATRHAAQALGLDGMVGNLLPGCEADFIAINPRATPLLARRTAQAGSLDELLFALIVLGDDRAVAHTVVQGQVAGAA